MSTRPKASMAAFRARSTSAFFETSPESAMAPLPIVFAAGLGEIRLQVEGKQSSRLRAQKSSGGAEADPCPVPSTGADLPSNLIDPP